MCSAFYAQTALSDALPTLDEQAATILAFEKGTQVQLAKIMSQHQEMLQILNRKPAPKKSPFTRFALEDDGAWRSLLYGSLVPLLVSKNYDAFLVVMAPIVDMIAQAHTAEHMKLDTARAKVIRFLVNRYVLLINALITTTLVQENKTRAGLISLIAQLTTALAIHHTNTEEVVTEEMVLTYNT